MGDAGYYYHFERRLAQKRMAMFARHGGLEKGDLRLKESNSRLDGLQAADTFFVN